ncbi:MAG: glycosyltransferase family 4 protein [Acidimicrobiales bacterium]|nr:glycosyltransferase family 4 protein [Acidimicrobiales bacterium]
MKVVAVSHTGLLSGAERVLLGQLNHLVSLGHDVTLACADGPLADEASITGLTVERIRELKPGRGPRVLALVGLAFNHAMTARPLRRLAQNADVVLFNSALALPATGGRHLGPPTGLFIHDVMIQSDRKAILRLFHTAVNRAFAVSNAAAAYARSLEIDTRVLFNGARFEIRDSDVAMTMRSTDPVVVGIVAALTPWKGHESLLEAISLVPDVHLEILGAPFPGDSEYEASLKRRAQLPDLAGRVHFLGHRPDVAEIMRRWSLSISASIEPEAGPLVVLESMALALPVVATALGGTLEVLGDAGVHVPPNDPPAMAAAITNLLEDTAAWKRCSAAGPRAIRGGLSLTDALQRFSNELAELAQREMSAPLGPR